VNPSNVKQIGATGDVTTADSVLKRVVLSAAADAATVVVRAGGSGGTQILTVKAAIATTMAVELGDVPCKGGIHATFTGTGPAASFIYE
jgi:ABC-type taurine transport system ATPase subunit